MIEADFIFCFFFAEEEPEPKEIEPELRGRPPSTTNEVTN